MTQENKDLLIKDLCSRLPYGVLIQEKCLENVKMFLPNEETDRLINIDVSNGTLITNGGSFYHIDEIKPYLFPMSSMTEEQKDKYQWLCVKVPIYEQYYEEYEIYGYEYEDTWASMDWLNENHFDYKELIPMGLAIDATGLGVY